LESNDPVAELGPQNPKDSSFTAWQRMQQSIYRANVLHVPFGVGPKPSNKTLFGNMLTAADGERGLNFLGAHIFTVVKRRMAEAPGVIDRHHLLCNLLSGSAMGFNLFAPLVDDRELAHDLLAAIQPDGPIEQIQRVALEFIPRPVQTYLNDMTAFDALVEYTYADGQAAFLGVDVCLTESQPAKVNPQPRYWELTRQADSPWGESSWPELLDVEIFPLWRRHLLALATRRGVAGKYKQGGLLVLYHPRDTEIQQAILRYQSLLKAGTECFSAMSLADLLSKWKAAVRGEKEAQWLEHFESRYLS
jgi:hypothetical protein